MIHFVVVVDSMHIGSACRDGVTRKETPLARFAISFFSLDPLLENRMYVVIYSMCCVQEFKPGYTAPSPLLELGHVPLHFRGNWGVSQREHRFITVVPADPTFLDDHHQYPLSSSTSFICCRSLVLIVRKPRLSFFFHAKPYLLDSCVLFTICSSWLF